MNKYFSEIMDIMYKSLEELDYEQYNTLLNQVEETLRQGCKIIVSGLGKNVPVCDKFAGTMLSLGFNANFLHTNSAVHGDMGMVKKGDLVIILTKSGNTAESIYLAELLKKRDGVNIWMITFSKKSRLIDILGIEKCLVVNMEHEGDLWNIVPNNSTTLNLILLQGIAIELSKRFELSLEKDFKPNHPGGAIGEMLKNV